jgi:hypothetical protein
MPGRQSSTPGNLASRRLYPNSKLEYVEITEDAEPAMIRLIRLPTVRLTLSGAIFQEVCLSTRRRGSKICPAAI